MVVNPKKYQSFAAGSIVAILELLFKTTIVLGEKISRTGLHKYLVDELNSPSQNSKISKTVYELKRSGYLLFENDSVRLTNKAKMRIVDQVAAKSGKCKKYHLVSFDIPEIKRVERNRFRRAIKRMGFVQIQKSLWVSNKNIGHLVDAATEEYRVSDYVAYFVSESSNIDRFIAKNIRDNKYRAK
jgi:CRISPR-associated endonuclease Cas2